jgi:hypothetical protein
MPSVRIEPCQYNGQSDSRFLCCLHGLRIVCEGPLEALGEFLHGLSRHAAAESLCA